MTNAKQLQTCPSSEEIRQLLEKIGKSPKDLTVWPVNGTTVLANVDGETVVVVRPRKDRGSLILYWRRETYPALLRGRIARYTSTF